MELVIILYVFLLCILGYLCVSKPFEDDQPPMAPGSLPIIGHVMHFFGDSVRFWRTLQYHYLNSLNLGGVSAIRLGIKTTIYVVTDPDDCATVASTCYNKAYPYKFSKPLLGEALILSKEPVWKRDRKLLNPAFSQQTINNYLEAFNEHVRALADEMENRAGTGPFDPTQLIIDNLFKIVCRTTHLLDNIDENSASQFIEPIEQILSIYTQRFLNLRLHLPFMYNLSPLKKMEDGLMKMIMTFSNNAIQKRKAELREDHNQKSDKSNTLIELLLRQGLFTDQQIINHCNLMVVATYDTTSFVLSSTLLQLGSHQDVQDRVFSELQDIIGDSETNIDKYDLSKMVYLEAVIKESLRLYPPAPMALRYIDKDVKLKNCTLRKGKVCVLSFYGAHRHPMWGADVEQFRPERWLEPGGVPDNPNAFGAFSLGKRNCIGKLYGMTLMKVYLAHLLMKYRVTADISKLVLKYEVLLKPVSGHEISLELRK